MFNSINIFTGEPVNQVSVVSFEVIKT